MTHWLLITVLSYLFFALAFLGDKLVLSSAPKPALYTFYIGLLNALVFLLLPFAGLAIPDAQAFLWIFADALAYIASLYAMFKVLEKNEASKVMTTVGALQPIIVLLLTWFFWGFSALSSSQLASFFLLLAGTVIISLEKNAAKTAAYLRASLLPALLFSLDFILQKLVYQSQGFLQGIFWMRSASFFLVLLFLFNKGFFAEVFSKKKNNVAADKKIKVLFLGSQGCGGLAGILQSAAIFLAPAAFLPIINSLRGMQYIFLFIIAVFLSVFFPRILKESLGIRQLAQKTISITMIVVGLALVF